MTLLEYLATHSRGATVDFMLEDIADARAANNRPFMELPHDKRSLEDGLRALKCEGKVLETWPEGAKEGVWRVGMKLKEKPVERTLFS